MEDKRIVRKGDFSRDSEWSICFSVERTTPHISIRFENERRHREFSEYFNRYDLKYLEEFSESLDKAIKLMNGFIKKNKPKKAIYSEKDAVMVCPDCGSCVATVGWRKDVCDCGQKIEWSE